MACPTCAQTIGPCKLKRDFSSFRSLEHGERPEVPTPEVIDGLPSRA